MLTDEEIFVRSVFHEPCDGKLPVSDACERALASCIVLEDFMENRLAFDFQKATVRSAVRDVVHEALEVAVQEGHWLAERFDAVGGGSFDEGARLCEGGGEGDFLSFDGYMVVQKTTILLRECVRVAGGGVSA